MNRLWLLVSALIAIVLIMICGWITFVQLNNVGELNKITVRQIQ